MLWLYFILLFGGIILLYFYLNGDEDFKKIPGPKGIFMFGNAFDFLMDTVSLFNYFRHLATVYKDIYKLRIGGLKTVLIINPEYVETVMTNSKHNEKGYLYYFLRPWLNDGLLLSSGSKWFERRKILTPAFHFNILRHFGPIFVENTEKLVKSLSAEVGKPKTNIYPFITNTTLNSICETAMGTSLDDENSGIGQRYKDGIHTLGTYLVYRATRVWLHFKLFFDLSPVGRKQKDLLNLLSTFRNRVIKQRRDNGYYKNLYSQVVNDPEQEFYSGKKRLAMLDLLLDIEEQGKIDEAGINEEVDTFMFEGHDTTSTALLFTMMLLANNQEEQTRAFEECLQIFGTSERTATMNDLAEMKYLESCIKESLRLYPPVYFISRKCEHTLNLKNYTCTPGTDCTILIFDLHRREDQFVEPLRFRPERFMEAPTWHPFSYIPFSAGSRNCIGQRFAMIEMKVVLSAVLRRFRLLPVTKPEEIQFVVDIILRTKDPIYVKFEER